MRCSPLYRPGKLRVLAPLSHRIMADPGKKACFLVREPNGDSFRDLGDRFRRALGRPSLARTPTFALAHYRPAIISKSKGVIRPNVWSVVLSFILGICISSCVGFDSSGITMIADKGFEGFLRGSSSESGPFWRNIYR